ncbi:MAG: prolipoprotein diacylglyceryl transferase family protein, partial [Chloroflexota bacterium]|nr:prolipoprotein diacylglyceryl transferase family protein [Chloroflexota bacterium]
VNGCCYGKPTSLPWAVVYSHAGSACGLQGIPLHPTQIYMLLWNLVVFAVVWQMRRRLKERGALFILYLWLYAIGDFVIRFFRVNEVFLWGLQQGQVISLAIFVGALSLFILKIRRTTSTEQSQEA